MSCYRYNKNVSGWKINGTRFVEIRDNGSLKIFSKEGKENCHSVYTEILTISLFFIVYIELEAYNLELGYVSLTQCNSSSSKISTASVALEVYNGSSWFPLQFPTLLENNFPVCDEPCYVYALTMELTKPLNFERAVRSRSKMQSTSGSYSLGILSRKQLPKVRRIYMAWIRIMEG